MDQEYLDRAERMKDLLEAYMDVVEEDYQMIFGNLHEIHEELKDEPDLQIL